MNNPRLAFSANLNRLKKYADQGELCSGQLDLPT